MANPMTLNEVQKKKLNDAINECVNSLIRSEGEKQYRKDTSDNIKDELNISTSMFNSLVNERYSKKSSDIVEKHEDIVALNEILVNSGTQQEKDVDPEDE